MAADIKRLFQPSAFWVGCSGILTQTLLFRELSLILRSNELILGLLLSAWLLSAGLGAILRPQKIKPFSLILIVLLSSSFSIPWLYFVANLLSPGIGQLWPFSRVIFIIVLVVFPQSYWVGSAFRALSEKRALGSDSSHTYIFEGIGSFFGGLISLFIAGLVRPDIALPVFSAIAILSMNPHDIDLPLRRFRLIISLLLVAVIPSLVWVNSTHARKLKGAESVERFESIHGAIELIENMGESSLFHGGIYLGNSGDSIRAGEIIHPLMVTSPKNPKVAVVGGILQGTVRIIGQYEPKEIHVLFEDKRLFDVCVASFRNFRLLADEDISVLFGDQKRMIKQLPEKLDLVFIYSGLPSSLMESRNMGVEAFECIAEKLDKNGRLAVGLPVSPNYLNPEELALISSLLGASRVAFGSASVYIVDGSAIIIAPDKGEFGDLIIEGQFLPPKGENINSQMIRESLESFRQAELEVRLSEICVSPNSDKKPIALSLGIKLWERLAGGSLLRSIAQIRYNLILIFLLLIFSFLLMLKIAFKKERLFSLGAIGAMGFFGMGASMVLMYSFQLAVGRLYSALGLLSSMFILGSVVGAHLFSKHKGKPIIWHLSALLAIPIGIFALNLGSLIPSLIGAVAFFCFSMLFVGFLCGGYYSMSLRWAFANGFWGKKAASKAYTLDLLGASLASPLVGVAIIPHYGLERTLLIILIFIIFAGMRISKKAINWRKNGQYE
ncbi:hypothetical protein KAH81_09680 [bacterium]|nr:hypothetical protein [bacterium]